MRNKVGFENCHWLCERFWCRNLPRWCYFHLLLQDTLTLKNSFFFMQC